MHTFHGFAIGIAMASIAGTGLAAAETAHPPLPRERPQAATTAAVAPVLAPRVEASEPRVIRVIGIVPPFAVGVRREMPAREAPAETDLVALTVADDA